MKKIQYSLVVLICSIGFFISTKAQQVPLVSQYFYSPMLYNPALTGKDQEVNIWLMDREQWTGVQGAPSTRGGTIDAGFLRNRLGAGLTVFSDKTDIINRFLIQFTLAGRVKLFKDAHLSLGVTPSLMDVRIDFQKANPEVSEDPHLFNQVKNRQTFDLNAGLAFTWRNLIVGFSVPQILNSRAKYMSALNATDMSLSRHYIGHASYKFMLAKNKFFIQPMALVKYTEHAPVQVEGNLLFGYKNIVWAGAGYRSGNGIMAMAGVGIKNIVTIGYAFDYHLDARVAKPLGGSHEVVLGIRIPYGNKSGKDSEYANRMKKLEENQIANKQTIDSLNAIQAIQKGKIEQLNDDLSVYKAKVAALDGQVQSVQKLIDDLIAKEATKTALEGNKATPKDNIFRLDGVYFETNSSVLKTESFDQLDRVAKLMKEKPDMKIKIFGHTDYVASDEYNNWLSERRAKSVQDYLVAKGVSSSRLSVKGFGKTAPIDTNDTEKGRANNRRVEIEVIQ